MWFLVDNIVTLHVAAVCAAFAWIFGGTMPASLLPVMPWLLAFLFEAMICFPQRHARETTYEARARVWGNMKRDPLTWLVTAFIILLLIPFFNQGLCPACSYPEINFDGQSAAPPVPFLPSCIDPAEHLTVVVWFIPTLIAMLAVKHALLKRGKRLLIELLVWNGLFLSLVGFWQSATDAPGPLWQPFKTTRAYFFSTFGYPNMAGDYFTTLFGLSIGLWRWKVEEAYQAEKAKDRGSSGKESHRIFWRKHALLIPAVVFFFSAMMTLSRASILLVSLLSILYFVHTLASFLKRMPRAKRVKAVAVNLIVLVLIATAFLVFTSDAMQEKVKFRDDFLSEVDSLNMNAILERTSGRGQYHVSVAFRIWKDYPLFGCGGWGYKHLCIPKMSDAEYRTIQDIGGINVHNDYVQFLAEHGAVGLGLLVMMAVLLVWPIGRGWRALMNEVSFTKPKDQPPKPVSVFILPAPVFCILSTTVATMLHALGDCPMRSPAVLALFFVSLASIDGFMPYVKTAEN